MDCLPAFSFPSATATFTSTSSPSVTPRKSGHRRKEAVTVPVIATVNLRTPIHYTPPRAYNRMSARKLPNSLTAIPEGLTSSRKNIPQPAASTHITPSLLSPAVRPGCFRSTSTESVTTTSSSCFDYDTNATPESCRFSTSNYTTSSGLEPFPRLSMCEVDEQMEMEEEDDEFWHCAGLEHRETLKSSTMAVMDTDMKNATLMEKVQAWRDSI